MVRHWDFIDIDKPFLLKLNTELPISKPIENLNYKYYYGNLWLQFLAWTMNAMNR
jgi:hypothetical protein